MIVSPSLLSANFANLQTDIDMINRSQCDWLHIDVMDGVFVPNISFGFPVLQHVARLCAKPLDVHLMIVQPEKFIREVAALGDIQRQRYGIESIIMNVHYEACPHLHRVIQSIHDAGMQAGVTLNPSTPVCMLEDIIDDVDLVLLMSVNPGFGGQSFISSTLRKVTQLHNMVQAHSSKAIIEIDGGVNRTTGRELAEVGAEALVAGSAVFGAPYPADEIAYLKAL